PVSWSLVVPWKGEKSSAGCSSTPTPDCACQRTAMEPPPVSTWLGSTLLQLPPVGETLNCRHRPTPHRCSQLRVIQHASMPAPYPDRESASNVEPSSSLA